MSLEDRLKADIRAQGPISVAQYMLRCLHDPQDGYYAVHAALGEDGDFITAPLVSQMFGELIGLWAVETWRRLGAPAQVIFAEVGPGDGSLMADALRAVRLDPDFLCAARVHLVETSAPLITLQRRVLAGTDARWTGSLAALPADIPLILVANELLDCLPTRQFVRTPQGWAERVVGLDGGDALVFGLSPAPIDALLPDAPPGSVFELSAAQASFGAALGERLAATGGAALLIDYGRAEPGFGDTFQALRRHRKVDPLTLPGQTDLTVHADFPAVAEAARQAGAQAAALITQAELLGRLGIEARAAALAGGRPDLAPVIARQLDRLTAADEMGDLFKCLALHAPTLGGPAFTPPAFEA